MAGLEILEILSPGIQTSIQDLGRYGYGRYGVAPSGALDSFALRIANLLVGNKADQAGLETMLCWARQLERWRIVPSLPLPVEIFSHGRNKIPIELWRSHVLKKDDIFITWFFAERVSGLYRGGGRYPRAACDGQ